MQLHQYKIIAYKDIDGVRKESDTRYADTPDRALQIYNDLSSDQSYSLIAIQTLAYKAVAISDFKKIYS